MAFQKLRTLFLKLEDPEHPLLGPTIKGLCLFGLWRTESKLQAIIYNIAHFCMVLLVCSLFVDIYNVRHDLNIALNNMSVSFVTVIIAAKSIVFIKQQQNWQELIFEISKEELTQLENNDSKSITQINKYKKYTRIVTYLYWIIASSTTLLMIVSPILKYSSSIEYREKIRRGEESLPQIMSSWFPFDNKKMPGYMWGVCFHVIMGVLGCGVIAVYDMNAVAIMSYLKGQMAILKGKCRNIFKEEFPVARETVVDNIKECHRHHSVLVEQYKKFNTLLSPIMFLYVLVSSSTICCSVIQFNLNGITKSEKYWVIQFTTALVVQLFLVCWHGNEVIIEAEAVDRGVYESDWWKGDKDLRKLALLLAAKLNAPMVLHAGPFTTLSVPAFVAVLKGSYSFYTLFSQIQNDK